MAITGLTIGVATCTSQGDAVYAEGLVRAVESVRFYGATTIGAACKVADAGSRVIAAFTCAVSYGSQEKYFPQGKAFNGVNVLSLGDGIVEITFR